MRRLPSWLQRHMQHGVIMIIGLMSAEWRAAIVAAKILVPRHQSVPCWETLTETEMLSFWWNSSHCLHRKLSFEKLSLFCLANIRSMPWPQRNNFSLSLNYLNVAIYLLQGCLRSVGYKMFWSTLLLVAAAFAPANGAGDGSKSPRAPFTNTD